MRRRAPRAPERAVRLAIARKSGRPRILALGCGGCLEWLPFMPELTGFKGELALQDADAGELALAERWLGPVVGPCRLLHGEACLTVKRLEDDDPFDLVLVGELFNSLPDSTVFRLLRSLYGRLLGARGVLLFSCLVPDSAAPITGVEVAERFGLAERSEARILQLCLLAGVPRDAIRFERKCGEPLLTVRIIKS